VEYVEQKHWDSIYETHEFSCASEDNEIRTWIEDYVPRGTGACLEIGCYPGTYLSVLGELGYEVSGIDLTPDVEEKLPYWLKKQGYRVGEFLRGNFLEYNTSRKYDVVCSFGFLEHFQDWSGVLRKQAELVEHGGYLVISTPNFGGLVQRFLHVTLDRENYNRHNVSSMNPRRWKRSAKKMGFEVIFSGCFGEFGFWNEEQKRNWLQKETLYYVHKYMPLIKRVLPKDKRLYSPFCGLVAKKK